MNKMTVYTEKNKLEEPKAASLWWIGLVAGVLVLLMAIVAIILMIRYNYPRQEYLCECLSFE